MLRGCLRLFWGFYVNIISPMIWSRYNEPISDEICGQNVIKLKTLEWNANFERPKNSYEIVTAKTVSEDRLQLGL
jgi:hypothetical protein